MHAYFYIHMVYIYFAKHILCYTFTLIKFYIHILFCMIVQGSFGAVRSTSYWKAFGLRRDRCLTAKGPCGAPDLLAFL